MKIVVHNASPLMGGGEVWNARLLAGLQQRGYRTLAICRNQQVAGKTAQFGVAARFHRIGGDIMFHHAFALARILRRERPDVLLLTTFKKVWLAGMAARLAAIPRVILRIGRSTDAVRNFTYRYPLSHWIDDVVLNAPEPLAAFRAEVNGAVRVQTIVDGVPAQFAVAEPLDLRAELKLPASSLLIGTTCRLSIGHKRLDRLIEVLSLLPNHVHAVVAGDGPDRERIGQLAGAANVEKRFHMLGFRDDVPRVVRALDVFVLCSDYEGLANSMLEALTAGIPAVSTPVSGAHTALHDGAGIVTGWSAREIAGAVSLLLSNTQLRATMAQRAAEVARTRFSFERMLNEWDQLLKTKKESR